MADRTISYRFTGNFTGLTAGLTAASRSVGDLGTKLSALDRDGARMRAGLTSVGNAAGKIGLGAGLALGGIVAVTAKFESAMSRVSAATNASADDLEALRQAAISAGADTVFSASEAANGITELAKAGLNAQQILSGGLAGALDLAAAGQIEVAQAAETTAITLQQFSLNGDQATRVADTLAAASGKAVGGVLDIAGALKYVGPVASQMGISVEEATGAIAELASQGVIGEQAGTSLRGVLSSLTSPSKTAAKEMEALGISVYDAQGNFAGIDGVAGQLKETMSGLTNAERDQALGRIFGNEQITAARILYAGGADAVQEWTDKVTDSGFAADQAAKLTNNLAGDLEQLKGSFETAIIGTGESSQGPLRGLVQNLTDVVNGYSALPGPAQSATGAALGLTAALGGGAFVFSKAVGGLANMQGSLIAMGTSAERASTLTRGLGKAAGATVGLGLLSAGLASTNEALGSFEAAAGGAIAGFSLGGPWGAAIGLAVGLVGSLATSHGAAAEQVDALTATLDKQTGAITDNSREWAIKQLSDAGALGSAKDLGLSLSEVTDAALGNADAIAAVNTVLDQYKAGSQNAAAGTRANVGDEDITDAQKLRDLIGDTSGTLAAARTQWQLENEAKGQSAATSAEAIDPMMGLTSATAGMGSVADAAAEDLKDLVEAMRDQRDAAIAGFDAETQYRQALKDAAKAAKETDAGIRGNSDAALDNRQKLSALAAAWNNQSDAVKDTKGRFADARSAFIQTATDMGVPKKAARDLATALLEIPPKRIAKVSVDIGDSKRVIDGIAYDLTNLKDRTVYINTVNRRGGAGGQGPAVTAHAAGGHPRANGGPPTTAPVRPAPVGAAA